MRKKIFDNKKQPTKSIINELFEKNVTGYLRNEMFSHSDILETSEIAVPKRCYNFNFPSMEQDHRSKDEHKALYFHTDADVVSSFLPFTENPVNRELVDTHRKTLNTWKSKLNIQEEGKEVKVNYDWNTDELKVRGVKDAFANVPDNCQFLELNFNKIKKAKEKLGNIMSKLVKEQQYLKCEEYKNKQTVRLP